MTQVEIFKINLDLCCGLTMQEWTDQWVSLREIRLFSFRLAVWVSIAVPISSTDKAAVFSPSSSTEHKLSYLIWLHVTNELDLFIDNR